MSWWWPFNRSVKSESKWTPEQQAWLDEFGKPTPANPTSDFIPSRAMVPYGQDVMEHWNGKLLGGGLIEKSRPDSDPHYCQPRVIEESSSSSIYFIVDRRGENTPRFAVVGPIEEVFFTDDHGLADVMKERFNSAFDLGVANGGWKE